VLDQQIKTQLAQYHDPYLDKNLGSVNAIKSVRVGSDQVEIELVLGYPMAMHKTQYIADLTAYLAPIVTLPINITIHTQIDAHAGKQGIPGLANIKNIIAVGSGKGGVGKSTVSVNLALALAKEGAKVGLLDADIYGPSQPAMLGTTGQKPAIQNNKFIPVEQHGIQSMSIGYLIEQTAAMVWRGPMLGKALQQLLQDSHWDNLDYLIIDLPPGTGDVQLTLCQKIPVSGAVLVTTPQDLALLDGRRAYEMFHKLNVPVLGVVENMSIYHCSQCGHAESIFGTGGAEKLSAEYQITVLGNVPLDLHIREMTDAGHPPVLQAPDSQYSKAFYEIARKTAASLALQTKDYSAKFPKIVVEQEKRGKS
jgi:ATP-binding protein involved in chromosome partitioning